MENVLEEIESKIEGSARKGTLLRYIGYILFICATSPLIYGLNWLVEHGHTSSNVLICSVNAMCGVISIVFYSIARVMINHGAAYTLRSGQYEDFRTFLRSSNLSTLTPEQIFSALSKFRRVTIDSNVKISHESLYYDLAKLLAAKMK